MKHPLIPGAGSDRRILADRIQQALQYAQRIGIGVLRHKEDVTEPLSPDLMHEFSKAFGVGEIQDRVGFTTMSVAPRNHQLIAGVRKMQYRLILLPAAHAVQLQRVDMLAITG